MSEIHEPNTTTLRSDPGCDKIKHVIVLAQENRSFDHYFGLLPGVRGFYDDSPLFKQAWPHPALDIAGVEIPLDPLLPNFLYPFAMDVKLDMGGVGHSWLDQHTSWDDGKLDQWLALRSATAAPPPASCMGYYAPGEIPFHTALATTFTICDNYYCSVIGPTSPNRMVLMTGSINPSGSLGGPVTGDPKGPPSATTAIYDWKSYPEQLHAAKIDCAVYEEDPSDQPGSGATQWTMNVAAYTTGWAALAADTTARVSRTGKADFEDDLKNGTLPTVSWIIPPYSKSEHPTYSPLAGANYLASKIAALMKSEYWESIALIITYDENGGCFDHVVPPKPPAGTEKEWITKGKDSGQCVGPGIRVPCIVVSPWTVGGKVCSQAFDHTSVLRFLGWFTGVTPDYISDYRKETFGDLTAAFDFGHHVPAANVPVLPAAPVPPPVGALVPLPSFPQEFPPHRAAHVTIVADPK